MSLTFKDKLVGHVQSIHHPQDTYGEVGIKCITVDKRIKISITFSHQVQQSNIVLDLQNGMDVIFDALWRTLAPVGLKAQNQSIGL